MPIYRSKCHSPLEASPNKYRSDVLSPLEALPTLYRSRMCSPLEAIWSPPSGPNLIGWYKFDEGSGLVVNNYATDGSSGGGLLPDLAVTNTGGNFWTAFPGFGYSKYANPNTYARAILPSPLRWGILNPGVSSAAIGIFYRESDGLSRLLSFSTTSPAGARTQIVVYSSTNIALTSNGGFSAVPHLNATWYFLFVDNNGYFCKVNPNGTLTVSAQTCRIDEEIAINFINVGYCFVDSYGAGGSYADFIIYNKSTLTRAQWAQWYDQLRSRYGMAARSGW